MGLLWARVDVREFTATGGDQQELVHVIKTHEERGLKEMAVNVDNVFYLDNVKKSPQSAIMYIKYRKEHDGIIERLMSTGK